jgi:FMN phosphatase YigB (HAD superfamily)
VKAENSVFLDDFDSNVEAARKLGMTGILVGDDADATLKELDAVLRGV